MIDPKTLLWQGGGMAAAIAVVAGAWNYIRTIWKYIVNIFIGEIVVKDDAAKAISSFVFLRGMRSPLGTKWFGGINCYVHPKRYSEIVAYEETSTDPILFKYNKRFALINKMCSHNMEGIGLDSDYSSKLPLKIIYIRKLFPIDQFITEAIEFFNDKIKGKNDIFEEDQKKQEKQNRFQIVRFSANNINSEGSPFKGREIPAGPSGGTTSDQSSKIIDLITNGTHRLLKWKIEDLVLRPEEGKSPFTGYPLPPRISEAIKEIDCWMKNEEWFRSKSIPWRRGWLLHGKPGTGKSTLVRSIAMHFNLPLYIFDLSTMNNNNFTQYWDHLLSYTPCIALIEDIDNIFDGRKYIGNMDMNSHLSFDCLLNCISGVKQSDGVFTIITTNYIDKIDPALGTPNVDGKSSRPGRMDKVIYLGDMERSQRLELANYILSDFPELVKETVDAGEGETAAQFQKRCADIAISKFWNNSKSTTSTLN